SATVHPNKGNFKRFSKLFAIMVGWINNRHQLGIGKLSTLLGDISEDKVKRREIIVFLRRIAANEGGKFTVVERRAATKILYSINIGPVVYVSPESSYCGKAGGVGLFIDDMIKEAIEA